MEIAEKPKVKRLAKVVPYLDGKSENMGLANYGQVLFDGANYTEELTCLESPGGVKRWLTGLNEFAPEVQQIKEPEKKAAKIKEIRITVAKIEALLAANVLDEYLEAKDFWDRVKMVHPTNDAYWASISIKPSNDALYLDPENPNHLVLLSCIKARGFSCIAPSFDDARLSPMSPKFFLDDVTETAVSKNEGKRLKNEALYMLKDLDETGGFKMMQVCKNIDSNPSQYTLSTSKEIMYDYLDAFINGLGYEKNQKRAANKFIATYNLPADELMLRAVIADAISYHKFISTKPDGFMYHTSTNVRMGRSIEEVYLFMKDPANADVTQKVVKEVESTWKN